MTTPRAAKEGLEVRLNEGGRRSGCRWLRMERKSVGRLYLFIGKHRELKRSIGMLESAKNPNNTPG
jgi:hypothetical protein